MNALAPGDKLIPFQLPAIDGKTLDSRHLQGTPFLLSFFRFATCPFCNLRMRQLVSEYKRMGRDFAIVAIFDAPLDHLTKHASKHQAPFYILADPDKRYYRKYGIQHSLMGMFKGMIMRMPSLIKGMTMGYWPFPPKGSMTIMPADLLIDAQGNVATAYYGKDEGDHLPIEHIIRFSQGNF